MIRHDHFEEVVKNRVLHSNEDVLEDTAGWSRLSVILHHLAVKGNRLVKGDERSQDVNIPAAVVGEDSAFMIIDSSRNVRLRIVALDRKWTADDLRPDSKVRSSRCVYFCARFSSVVCQL